MFTITTELGSIRNRIVKFSFGPVEFDDAGLAQIESEEQLEIVFTVPGYKLFEGSPPIQENDEEELEGEEDPEVEVVDLHALTVKELEKMAREKGIDLEGVSKKADIIAVIEAAAE